MSSDASPTALLYYPDFYPNVRWLKSILLLVDEVQRIVPLDVTPDDSETLRSLRGELNGGLTNISPHEFDTVPDAPAEHSLDCAFGLIRRRLGKDESRRVRFVSAIRPDGKWEGEYKGYTFLFDQKLSSVVRHLLEKHDLARPDIQAMANKLFNIHGSTPVQEDAANLVLSFIADRIARRHGLMTITDQPLGFAMNELDPLNYDFARPPGIAEGGLAALVAPVMIPAHVDLIPLSEYKRIRESHADIRAAFGEFLREYIPLHRLDKIEDVSKLHSQLKEKADSLQAELTKFRKSWFSRTVHQWAHLTFSSLFTIARAKFGPLNAAGEILGGVAVKKLEKACTPKTGTKDKLFRLVAELDDNIRALGTAEEMADALSARPFPGWA